MRLNFLSVAALGVAILVDSADRGDRKDLLGVEAAVVDRLGFRHARKLLLA